jgi:hypothetical protein
MHAEEKQKLLADENNRGYTPFAEETLDPANQSRGDTKEGFYFGRCATAPLAWRNQQSGAGTFALHLQPRLGSSGGNDLP